MIPKRVILEKAVLFIEKLYNKGKGITQDDLGKKLDVSQNSIHKYLTGKGYPGKGTLDLLLKEFPEAKSFIYDSSHEMSVVPEHSEYMVMIPLVHAYASYMEGWNDQEWIGDLPKFPMAKKEDGKYMAFEVRSDSMQYEGEYSLREGDIVVGRELQRHHWTNKLHIPRVFIIHHKSKGIMIKQIIFHDIAKAVITCHSFNVLYPDFNISLNDVNELYYCKDVKTFCGLAYVPLVQTLKLRTHLIAALRQAAVMCSCGLWNENV